MSGIFEKVASLAGSEVAKATNLAHDTFRTRVSEHGHTGRALVESVAQVCRNHPNLIGIAAGFIVEQLLMAEKHRHDAHHGPGAAALPAPHGHAAPPAPHPGVVPGAHLPHHVIRVANLRPGHIAMEVFGGLIMLKLAATGARMFRHKHQGESWFAHAARIHLFSGTLAAYYFAKALKSPKISSWRNAAILLYGTDAVKPLLRHDPRALARARAAATARAVPVQNAPAPAPPSDAAQPVAVQPGPPQPEPQPQPAPQPAPQTAPNPAPQTAPLPAEPPYVTAAADPGIGHGRVVQAFSVGMPSEASPYQPTPPANS